MRRRSWRAAATPTPRREGIKEALVAEGNTASRANARWDDTSGDGHREPLLDVGSEAVFDPAMVGEGQAAVDCDFAG